MSTQTYINVITSTGRVEDGAFKCDVVFENDVNGRALVQEAVSKTAKYAASLSGILESSTVSYPSANIVRYTDVYSFKTKPQMMRFAQAMAYTGNSQAVKFTPIQNSLANYLSSPYFVLEGIENSYGGSFAFLNGTYYRCQEGVYECPDVASAAGVTKQSDGVYYYESKPVFKHSTTDRVVAWFGGVWSFDTNSVPGTSRYGYIWNAGGPPQVAIWTGSSHVDCLTCEVTEVNALELYDPIPYFRIDGFEDEGVDLNGVYSRCQEGVWSCPDVDGFEGVTKLSSGLYLFNGQPVFRHIFNDRIANFVEETTFNGTPLEGFWSLGTTSTSTPTNEMVIGSGMIRTSVPEEFGYTDPPPYLFYVKQNAFVPPFIISPLAVRCFDCTLIQGDGLDVFWDV